MASGSLTELSGSGCPTDWQCVDDVISDGDASYVECPTTAYSFDLYGTEDSADTTCGIVSVTVHISARRFVKDAYGKAVIRTNGALFEGPEEYLNDDYSEFIVQWMNNPGTGSSWTWQEITDIEIGVGLRSTKATHSPRCSRVWLTVEQTP
jgi:hypothetical protein